MGITLGFQVDFSTYKSIYNQSFKQEVMHLFLLQKSTGRKRLFLVFLKCLFGWK